MAGVKADNQALSPWLLPDSTILAKTPYVFGALHADLLRRLAKRKHLQPRRLVKRKELQPGGSDVNCLDGSSSEDLSSWSDPSELEDPEVALRRLLSDSVGSEKADSSPLGILDPFEGKDILIVTTNDDHTTVVLLERSPLPDDDRTWKVSSWDSLVRVHKRIWDNELKDGMTLLLEKTGLKTEKSNFLYN
jgi:hypothetical protein